MIEFIENKEEEGQKKAYFFLFLILERGRQEKKKERERERERNIRRKMLNKAESVFWSPFPTVTLKWLKTFSGQKIEKLHQQPYFLID